MSEDIERIIKAARVGGDILKKYFGLSLETVQKTTISDFKTKADIESEQAILQVLENEFPGYNIFSEEKGETVNGSDYTFVVDPLDGTNNFVLGFPNFSVSIGLLKGDEIVAGVIYVPMIDNVYYAQKGEGAFCDGKKLVVSGETQIKKSTICYICGYQTHFEKQVSVMNSFYRRDTKRVMINWSPTFDFCMLASGRVESVINHSSELHDFAAGKLIAREAGAVITSLNGQEEKGDTNSSFVASSSLEIHEQVLEILK